MSKTNAAGADARRHGLWPLFLLLILASAGLAVHLTAEIVSGKDIGADKAILLAFRTPGDLGKPIGPSWMLQSAIDLSALGGFTFIWLFTAATSGFFILVKRWWALSLFLTSIVGVSVLNAVVKISFHRARPEIVPHLAEVSNASFPSGHAMISAATYLTIGGLLAQSQQSRGARGYLMSMAAIISFLIGVSRLYLGVHWPSDVFVGWIVGSAWSILVWFIARRIEPVSPGPAVTDQDSKASGQVA